MGPPSSESVPQTARKYSTTWAPGIAAMGEQAVIAHADAEVDGKDIERDGDNEVGPAEEEQSGDGAEMEEAP